MFLAISTNSFHYKYYQLLRKMWNFDGQRERTSLCTYTQFLFWFSLLTFISLPLMLGGWLLLKTFRLFYKICSWTSSGRKIIDGLDVLGLGDRVDRISMKMGDCPAATLCLTFAGFVGISTLIFIVLFGLFCGVWYFKTVLMVIAAMIMGLSLIVFYLCFGVGWLLANAAVVVVFVAKWLALLIVTYVSAIILCLGLLAIMSLVSFIVIKIVMASETLMNFLGFKLNGYYDARQKNAKRREELAKIMEEERRQRMRERDEGRRKKAHGEIPYTLLEKIGMTIGMFFLAIGRAIHGFLIARTKNVKGGSYKVMTVGGVFWETLKSLKYGVCPLVEFLDDEESEDAPK